VITCPNCGEENPAKFRLCGFCGTPLAPPAPVQEVRKLVTILFCDLKGSTSLGETLDSESLREVMNAYFESMSAAINAHGGTIEKFIGDAVMAVFGLPRVHEDDALRAVRAAKGMQEGLVELNERLEVTYGVRLANRIGVNTGEVVAGDPTAGQRLVTGDPVNVAARLEQAAGESEALLGALTYRLVRESVEVEEVEPLELKGKAERVPAYRLVSVSETRAGGSRRRPLVGREEELSVIESELDVVMREGWTRLVTLLAEPGVGKSRLLTEVAARAEDRATFISGRCLSYGRGITFWPVIEAIRELAGIGESDPSPEALAKLLAAAGGDQRVADRVASVMGLSERQLPLEETFWGIRRLFERASAERPLIVCFEDIHWAEQTLLDLIEQLIEGPQAAPILVLCAARPTLLEIRSGWEGRGIGRMIALEPLSGDHTKALVRDALPGADLSDRILDTIVTAAEGNPLFASQIVSMLLEEGALRKEGGEWVTADSEIRIPPTIQALLAARLDLLNGSERSVVESASVIGLLFARPAVEHLVSDPVRPEVHAHLASLTEKHFVRHEEPDDDEAYRFDHILIRDTAYHGLLKRARATLHEKFVEWGERVNEERDRSAEYDDILGYHLEQAHLYLGQLGPLDDHGRSLGVRGATKLGAAGRRAFARGDMPAAANLLRRAAALREPGDPARLELFPMLAESLMESGEFAWAETVLDEADTESSATGNRRLQASAELTRLFVHHRVVEDLASWHVEVEETTGRLIPELEGLAAHAELAKAWRLLGFVHGASLHYGQAVEVMERALEHARAAGDHRLEARLSAGYTIGLSNGPTAAVDAVARCREVLSRDLPERQAEAITRCSLGVLLAMQGAFDEAREQCDAARELLTDLGGAQPSYAVLTAARIELLAGNPEAVTAELSLVYDDLGKLGERYFRPVIGATLAVALHRSGESARAAALVTELAESTDADDYEAWGLLEGLRGRLLAAESDEAGAVEAAQRAVDLLAPTDAVVFKADALVDLGDTLVAVGAADEGRTALAAALELYERKGNVVAAARLNGVSSQSV
jgi:class 3 adenylate cyclase/tetratricopeptide (TPR) repeat protein